MPLIRSTGLDRAAATHALLLETETELNLAAYGARELLKLWAPRFELTEESLITDLLTEDVLQCLRDRRAVRSNRSTQAPEQQRRDNIVQARLDRLDDELRWDAISP